MIFLGASTALDDPASYETLVGGQAEHYEWGRFSENAACGLCYTSGTTGDPKGVLYSHRSNYLHTLMSLQSDAFGLGARDVVMPIVPMFHANAWGLAFSAPAVGAKLVLPGRQLDGPSVHQMIESEGVTFAAAVPTVWQSLLTYLQETGKRVDSLSRAVVGGSACPIGMIEAFRNQFGVEIIHAWGMTELSPLGTIARPTAETSALPPDRQLDLSAKQGRPMVGLKMRLHDDASNIVPHDGVSSGKLMVRGETVAARYFAQEDSLQDDDGYFDTGDVATIDRFGFMQITDRSKDIIKSGGEWISSLAVEREIGSHPAVENNAVVAIPHPKWGERPVAFVQLKPGQLLAPEAITEFLIGRISRWWVPDNVLFVKEMPLGATGKIDKKILRRDAALAKPAQGIENANGSMSHLESTMTTTEEAQNNCDGQTFVCRTG